MSKYAIYPGDGRIRHQEMIQELSLDVGNAFETLEQNRDSQFLRRCVVRAVFTYIESAIECIKHEIRYTLRVGHAFGSHFHFDETGIVDSCDLPVIVCLRNPTQQENE